MLLECVSLEVEDVVDVWERALLVHFCKNMNHPSLEKVRCRHYPHGQCEALVGAKGHDNCEIFFCFIVQWDRRVAHVEIDACGIKKTLDGNEDLFCRSERELAVNQVCVDLTEVDNESNRSVLFGNSKGWECPFTFFEFFGCEATKATN